jgi:hypothetical protein
MAHKIFNPFWIAVTAILTVIVWAVLFPRMLEQYGLARALLLSIVLVFAMSLYYVRGWWVSSILNKKANKEKDPGATAL